MRPEELPIITSCFGVIFEENQYPLRVYLAHNNPDPHSDSGGYNYKPEGFGLPGGGGEKGETPLDAAKREVKSEIGITADIATRGGEDSKAGEILFELKPIIDIGTSNLAINEIYIFHLKKIDIGFARIKETDETGRLMLATFGSVLMMPLARNEIKNPDGSVAIVENPEGIYFSTRERIFGVAEHLGYDFYELIPNLDELFPKLKREEVGNYVYNLLADIVRKKNELYERRAQRLRPDDEELLERYSEWAVRQGG